MKLINLKKNYVNSNCSLQILKNINVEFKKGNFYAIMGRSGSGKTTLVNILGLLDNPTDGDYYIDNINTSKLTTAEKTNIRGLKIGFVFQSFYLNPRLTALENTILPTFINPNIDKKARKELGKELLKKLGLQNRYKHYPNQLSGGEQQRVAIARAIINNPEVIIADEPTGNLDSKNEKEVFEILRNISKEDKIVIVVSHNAIIKDYCDILYELNDGVLSKGEL